MRTSSDCPQCGQHFTAYYTKKYCSRICMAKAMRGNKRFSGHTHSAFTRKLLSQQHRGMTYPRAFGEKISKSLEGKTGAECRAWKGGKITEAGYRRVYVKPYGRYRLEHRMIAEQTLGRPLRSNEVVHHKNLDKLDNRPENLEILTKRAHALKHALGTVLALTHCPRCGLRLDTLSSKAP